MLALNSMWEINNFGDAVWLSLLCVAVVFAVLTVITLIMAGLNKIKALDVKEKVILANGQEADDDMVAAMLVASIDYRKTCKEDFKIASVKLIEQEKKRK